MSDEGRGASIDDSLPARLTASEVCHLAGYGRVTLGRRIRDGKMPPPVDRGKERLFDRAAVYRALGMDQQFGKDERRNPFEQALDALPPR